jgi:hypothetical protein
MIASDDTLAPRSTIRHIDAGHQFRLQGPAAAALVPDTAEESCTCSES